MTTLKDRTLAVLGAGSMGAALIRGILRASKIAPGAILATSRSPARLQTLRTELGIGTTHDNAEAVRRADVVLLCVKPQGLAAVAPAIRDSLKPGQPLLSILAGVTTTRLEKMLRPDLPVVRIMPNIPAMVDAAASAWALGRHALPEHGALAAEIFGSVGDVIEVNEAHLDAVTGLSGSGPAYIYMIIEALTDGGVKMGLPRDVAIRLATQTVLGSAKLVKETGLHPAILRDQVTTPGGTAIAAIHDLESHGLRPMLISAVVTATQRSAELNALAGGEVAEHGGDRRES